MWIYYILISSVIIFLAYCEKRQANVNLAVLDTNSTKKFDIYVRREILFNILTKINETNYDQVSSSEDCKTKLNATILQCQKCLSSCNGLNQDNYTRTFQQLIPTIFKPVLEVSGFVDKIGSSVPTALNIFGEESGLFITDLGQISSYLGTGLFNSSHQFSGIATGLEALGSKLATLSKDLVLVPLNKLPVLESGDLLKQLLGISANNLLNQVENGFSSIGDALKDIGNKVVGGLTDAGDKIVDVGNNIGNVFHNIFGKRQSRSCDTQCADCNKIDLKSHDATTILALVCGEAIIYNQRNTVQQITYLQRIYNNTLENQLITKIEYDPTTIKTDNRIAFSTSYMSYQVQGNTDRFRSDTDFEIGNLKKSAGDVANQIWNLMN